MPLWKSLRNILTRMPQWKSTGSTGCLPTPSSSFFCSLHRAKNIICNASLIFVTIFLSWMFMKCYAVSVHVHTQNFHECLWKVSDYTSTNICPVIRNVHEIIQMFMICKCLICKCLWYANVYDCTSTYIRPAIRNGQNYIQMLLIF